MKMKLFVSQTAVQVEESVNDWLRHVAGFELVKSETTVSVISIPNPKGLELEPRVSMAIWYNS